MSGILGIRREGNSGNYLGLPSMVGQNKCEVLGFINTRIINRVKGWCNRFLSKAGREVLLKNVLQAIPVYAMSVVLLPRGVVREVEIVMNAFWWGRGGEGRKGIHWQTWHRLCIPKKWGRMGFKKLREFYIALLSKQAWRIIENPNSLVACIIKAKYFPNSTFLEARKG